MISLELSFRQTCAMLYEEKIQRSFTLIISIIIPTVLRTRNKILEETALFKTSRYTMIYSLPPELLVVLAFLRCIAKSMYLEKPNDKWFGMVGLVLWFEIKFYKYFTIKNANKVSQHSVNILVSHHPCGFPLSMQLVLNFSNPTIEPTMKWLEWDPVQLIK